MRARLTRILDAIQTGFWFVPIVMLLLAFGLALLLLYIDQRVDPGMKASLPWAYTGGPEGARSLLSTIAGSMITAASVTFSLASVALSIASQQYGSRVLRNFMRDRVTQMLLGTFVSTFLYSVMVVRTIRGSDYSGGFVPAIAVTVAIGLSLASLVLLIYFIHHVSTSIQAAHIVKVIAEDLGKQIPKLYPAGTGEPGPTPLVESDLRQGASTDLWLEKGGYLQTVDLDTLLDQAAEQDVLIEVRVKPGDHIVRDTRIGVIWGKDHLPDKARHEIKGAFYVGGQRTAIQDIRYQFQQLTDVVVRALSPGINDPFTAINGIDELTAGLVEMARQPRVNHARRDSTGTVRLLLGAADLCEAMDETLGHIVIYGATDRFVMRKLRRALNDVEPLTVDTREKETIARLRHEFDVREQAKRPEGAESS